MIKNLIQDEMDRMVERGELTHDGAGNYTPTSKFPKSTKAEIDAMLDKRSNPIRETFRQLEAMHELREHQRRFKRK